MPTTGAPGNIWYPDANSPVAPLENLFLQQAASVNDALSALTPGSAWTTYTPTLTDMVLGNGTLVAKHRKNGASRDVVFVFTFGSTSSISNTARFTLPLAAPYASSFGIYISDSGTDSYPAFLRVAGGVAFPMTLSGGYFSSTQPFTWVAGDRIEAAFTYLEN